MIKGIKRAKESRKRRRIIDEEEEEKDLESRTVLDLCLLCWSCLLLLRLCPLLLLRLCPLLLLCLSSPEEMTEAVGVCISKAREDILIFCCVKLLLRFHIVQNLNIR
jgi:hypothetical protein